MGDQPRWPRGAPDDERGHGQGGRFRDGPGPGGAGRLDWAEEMSRRLRGMPDSDAVTPEALERMRQDPTFGRRRRPNADERFISEGGDQPPQTERFARHDTDEQEIGAGTLAISNEYLNGEWEVLNPESGEWETITGGEPVGAGRGGVEHITGFVDTSGGGFYFSAEPDIDDFGGDDEEYEEALLSYEEDPHGTVRIRRRRPETNPEGGGSDDDQDHADRVSADDYEGEMREFVRETLGWARRVPEQYPGLKLVPTQARDLSIQRDVYFHVHSGDEKVGTITAIFDKYTGEVRYNAQPEVGDGGVKVFDNHEGAVDYLSSAAISDASKTDLDRYYDDLLWYGGSAGDEMYDHGRGRDDRRLAGLLGELSRARETGHRAAVARVESRLRAHLTRLGYTDLPTKPAR